MKHVNAKVARLWLAFFLLHILVHYGVESFSRILYLATHTRHPICPTCLFSTAIPQLPLNQVDDATLEQIFLQDLPLLDVRAEVEFAKGAFPTSVNLPLLDTEQRRLVGTCYKEKGPPAAVALGQELLRPLQSSRLKAWQTFCEAHPTGYLYCQRGGMRSQITRASLKEFTGIEYPLIPGGFQRLRQFLIQELERIPELPLVMIGGRTASGKTNLLYELSETSPILDLEGLANHRGSTFGALVEPQPTPIAFENQLAIQALKLRNHHHHLPQQRIFMEEEGRRIGQRVLPLSMHQAMLHQFPVVELVTPMEERVQICIHDYVTSLFSQFESKYGSQAQTRFQAFHMGNLERIQKRVPHYCKVRKQMTKALDDFCQSKRNLEGFVEPVQVMLQFYDEMYDYQADQRKGPVLFRGDRSSILEWARHAGRGSEQ